MAELINDVGSYKVDQLIAGTYPQIVNNVTIVSGAGSLARGAVLGLITASGKYTLVDSTKSDGSQVASCILADAVDATSADVVAPAYMSGQFNSGVLTFGGTDTADKHEAELRDKNIYLSTFLD